MDPFVVIPLELEEPVTFPVKNDHKTGRSFYYNDRNTVNQLSFEDFLSKNCNKMTKSTVGYRGDDIINEDVRRSSVIKDIRITVQLFHECHKTLEEQIKKIIPIYFRGYNFYSVLQCDHANQKKNSENRKWDLVIYTEEDKFVKHTDGKDNDQHHATLLLFPPSDINHFTGGELVFYQSGQQIAKIEPNHFPQWTLVAFPTNVEHECLPILSGVRYVFKSKLHLPKDFIDLYEIKKDAQPLQVNLSDVEDEIKEFENKIASYEQKIENVKKNIQQLRNLCPRKETLDIVEKIKTSESTSCLIVLQRYYDNLDPNYLIGEDRLLYNAIVSCYPQTKLGYIKGARHNLGDGSDGARDELYIDDNLDNGNIIYQKDISRGNTPGETTDQETEYNDSTYDTIVTTDVTVIAVSKSV